MYLQADICTIHAGMQQWLHPTFSKEQCLLHTYVCTLMCDKLYHFIIRLLLLLLGNNRLISLILTIESGIQIERQFASDNRER